MDKALAIAEGTLPILIKNTRFHISIAGWPAAVSVIAFCGAYVAVYAIRANHPELARKKAEVKKEASPSKPGVSGETESGSLPANPEMEVAAA